MRKLLTLCCLIGLGLSAAVLAEDGEESNPLQPLARLIGVWQGDLTLNDGSRYTVGVDFEWGLNRKVIRYSIYTLNDQQKQAYAEGTYWWNPKDKTLEFREYNAYGSSVAGTVQPQGDALEAEWTEITASGGINHYKDTIRFPTPNSWTSFPYQKQGDDWQTVMEKMTYRRQ